KLRVVVGAPLKFLEAVRCLEFCVDGVLNHHQGFGLEPAAIARRVEGLFRQVPAVGRIEKHEGEWLKRMRWTEPGRIAAENARYAAEAERLDVSAQQCTRFHAFVDKQRVSRAARYCFDAQRAGAREQVEDARAVDRIAVGMREDVEQGLAQAIGGG